MSSLEDMDKKAKSGDFEQQHFKRGAIVLMIGRSVASVAHTTAVVPLISQNILADWSTKEKKQP